MASSPPPRVSHRFDGHLPEARNTVVHPIVTPFGRHHAQPRKAPVTVAAWGRMGCVLQAHRIARYEYIPTPDMHLLRPSACLLRLAAHHCAHKQGLTHKPSRSQRSKYSFARSLNLRIGLSTCACPLRLGVSSQVLWSFRTYLATTTLGTI
jgi:hypothetical protein